jgi:hypothetical protein
MMTLVIALRTRFQTPHGRRTLAHRTLVGLLALAMLLVPATCAEAAGPHSIYADPTAGHAHHGAGETEQARPMTQAELEWLVLFGGTAPGTGRSGADQAGTPVEQPTGPDGSRFTDLPSTMAMAAATMPAMLNDDFSLDLPVADGPVAHEPIAPALTTVSPESPPPQQ